MNYPYMALIILMSMLLGYILYWAVLKLRQVWQIYVVGRELKDRWDEDVVDLMAGDKDE